VLKKIFPGLLISACFVGGLAPSVLAQGTMASPVESQPQTTTDLQIEDLMDEQVAQMEAIFAAYEPSVTEATDNYLAALEMMNNLLVPETADLALSDAHSQVLTTKQVLDTVVFERNLALRSVLTLDQRQTINDYVRAYLGLAPAEPMAVFPDNLMGLDVDPALDTLLADGWDIVVTTPAEIQLDRGSEKLNLALNRSGQIIDVELFD
jgi:Spy/CpxP family protein refolding chaperone